MRAAHAQKWAVFAPFLREGFVMKLTRGFGIERQVELIFPPKFEARFADRVVAVLRAGMAFGQVGGVGGESCR